MPSGGGGIGGGRGVRRSRIRRNKSSSVNRRTGNGGVLSLIIVLALIILAVVVAFALSRLRSSDKSTPDGVNIATDFYSPGDSRLLSFSSFFCESLSLDVNSAGTGASLTVVNSPPLLTDRNSFNISVQQDLVPRNYHFWQYYLYPGSNISVNVCTLEGSATLDVYVVKGNSNANKWGRSPSSRHAELVEVVRETYPQNNVITYTANEEDEYYIFFLNMDESSGISYTATLKFERFEYAPPTNTSFDSCSPVSGEQCTVDVPYGTGSQQVLVTTTIPEDVDWGENVDVNIKCNSRHWAYAVVVIPILIAFAVLVGLLVLCVYLYCKYKYC